MKEQVKQYLAANGVAEKAIEIYEGTGQSYAEKTIRDIVLRVVQYGKVSEKSLAYLKALLVKAEAPVVPVPVGRVLVKGVVAKAEVRETRFGYVPKMLVKAEQGWAVWVSIPAKWSIAQISGKAVEFVATIQPSPGDPSFGFGSRPSAIAVAA